MAAIVEDAAGDLGAAWSAAEPAQSPLLYSLLPDAATSAGAPARRISAAPPQAPAERVVASSPPPADVCIALSVVAPSSGGQEEWTRLSSSAAAARALADSCISSAAAGVTPALRRGGGWKAEFFQNTLLQRLLQWQAHGHGRAAPPLLVPDVTTPLAERLWHELQQPRTATGWRGDRLCSTATEAAASFALADGAAAAVAGSPPTAAAAGSPAPAAASGGSGRSAAGGDKSSGKGSGQPPQQRTFKEILDYAAGQALKGGVAGASAQVLNVFAFMWLRTTMNYQYRYGKSTIGAIKQLYAEGGVVRFYRGLLPALMQSPLSRFGDTAANVGVLAALDSKPVTRELPVGVKTALASCGAAAWRFFLMPIDAWKTTKQVEGGSGLRILVYKVRHHGFSKLYHGSVAAMGATWVGHYPWFFMHNYLSERLPQFDGVPQGRHVRYGLIGFISSVVSDTCSNSIRVLKTSKQTSIEPMTYPQALREVLTKDGVTGLLFRGLGTRILTNGLQGMVFSVGWKAIQSHLSK